MRRSCLAAITIILCLGSAVPALAQRTPDAAEARRVHLALMHSASLPGGGWGWAEAVRTSGVRIGVPVAGHPALLVSARAAPSQTVVCPAAFAECAYAGTPYLLRGGIGYRFGPERPGRLVPYAGAGASLG